MLRILFYFIFLSLISMPALAYDDDGKHRNYIYEEPGFSHYIQYGQFFGLGDSKGNKYRIDYSVQFRINEHIAVGPAVGFEIYPNGKESVAVPVYMNLVYNYKADMYSPYANFGTGYTIGYGYYYKFGGGFNIASDRHRYIMNIGLQIDVINNENVPTSLGIVVGLNL